MMVLYCSKLEKKQFQDRISFLIKLRKWVQKFILDKKIAFFPSISKNIEWILEHEKSVINSTEDMESLVDFEKKVKNNQLEKQKKILEKSYNDAVET